MAAPALQGKWLHFDGASGVAGDMVLGALIDVGVPVEVVRGAVEAMGVDPGIVHVQKVTKNGVAATDVHVHDHDHDHDHVHDHVDVHEHEHEEAHAHEDRHGHGHGHGHTAWKEIERRIVGAGLGEGVKRRALDIFRRVAEAEAKIHGVPVDDVVFHEVGAIDSIVDIVGAAAALDWLAPLGISSDVVVMGEGMVKTAHGMLPVPSPAALLILKEARGAMMGGGVRRELCTPTGAAILAASVLRWGGAPAVTPLAIGYGAGDADLVDRPNVLRAILGEPPARDESLFRIEANVDDMSPEMCEHAAEALFAAGAIDVWWTPITMKKSRPAVMLGALAPEAAREAVVTAVLRETTSIGVRFDRVGRRILAREVVEVDTPYGRLPVKVARLGGEVVNAAPEYEACRKAAQAAGVPLKIVYAAAVASYMKG